MLEEVLEYITGGTLIVAVLALLVFGTHIMTRFTIRTMERRKPGSWSNKSENTYRWHYEGTANLWAIFLFLTGALCAKLCVYPFMMSLYHKLGIL